MGWLDRLTKSSGNEEAFEQIENERCQMLRTLDAQFQTLLQLPSAERGPQVQIIRQTISKMKRLPFPQISPAIDKLHQAEKLSVPKEMSIQDGYKASLDVVASYATNSVNVEEPIVGQGSAENLKEAMRRIRRLLVDELKYQEDVKRVASAAMKSLAA